VFAEPQLEQMIASEAPHSPQNFRPPSFSVPQFPQIIGARRSSLFERGSLAQTREAEQRTPSRIVTTMLEARFDDLTGASPSFRLAGPVGVVEATRAGEVVETLEAAEAAAGRGLWVAGFVAYEAAPGLDPALTVGGHDPEDPFASLPLAWFAMFERAEETDLPCPREDRPDTADAWVPTTGRERYRASIARIRELIARGETYQVNHTIRLRSRLDGDPRGLYRDLCFAQRSAFAAYLDVGRYRIASASPELFFERRGDQIATRPMKGTAPRGRWPAEDRAVATALLASAKDRAENAMIVDLLRNDLGRIARPGTVTWTDAFEAERYETVWQLTTTVSATLAAEVGIAGIFRALFPSGSVTGAPKVRTMEIIRDLEDAPRGVYCGAVGYLAPAGSARPDARFNVAIRTVTVDTSTGTASYGVGGGITWDSAAETEYEETVAKADVLTARRPVFQLFETMRYEPGEGVRHVDEHLQRLSGSADHFGFRLDPDEAREAVEKAAASAPPKPCRIRLTLSRNGAMVVACTPLPPDREPVRLAIDHVPQDPRDVFLFHKTTLRRRYEEARRRHPGAEDVLLINDRGGVTGSTIANVAVRLAGTWWTPPTDAGLLPGVGRALALAEGSLQERPIAIEEVRAAGEVALVSDTRGWRRVNLVPTG
jgi:para-aminobenzoate synthetase / 4-amino-4-deoxychorismate lyase